MQCPRCLNTDETYFYKGSRGWYCRRCISFGRVMLEESREPVSLESAAEGCEEYTLQYPLTEAQKRISHACAEAVKKKDVLLHCVCGAGKTELVVESIAQALREKKKVCFAIPRRQVVLELCGRLSAYFPQARVTAVCGGHTSLTDGDLIICTTHQLYRYYQAFDLLIMDEPDAFPFRGDAVLHGIAKVSCRGHVIWLTATPDETLLEEVHRGSLTVLQLTVRPHGHALPVPQIVVFPGAVLFVLLVRWLIQHRKHPRMVFVPTVRTAYLMHRVFSVLIPCEVCTSRNADRDKVLLRFREKKNGIIFATTVLERGVTVERADICVFHAENPVFDTASLIQMAGRAGRSFRYPHGDVLFLCTGRSRAAEECADNIRRANGS